MAPRLYLFCTKTAGVSNMSENEFARTLGHRVTPAIGPLRPPTEQERAWVRRMARHRTRVPKGIFRYASTAGWLPPPLPDGLKARLVWPAVPRFEVVSGWDLAAWKPKPAERAVPVGAVYWFDEFEGDPGKLAEWVAGGLWQDNPDACRRVQGYNNALLAAWP